MAAALADVRSVEHAPPAEPKRLTALREAVQNGTLETDNEALANSILDEDASWPAIPVGGPK